MDDDLAADEAASQYIAWEKISPTGIRGALGSLMLFDDPNFRNQAFNLGLVDVFCMQLESQLLKKQFHAERTPLPEVTFLSAQSQMWIFAAYELMRTWRQRAKDMLKWHESGGLEGKLAHLKRKTSYQHVGRLLRASQIERVLADSEAINKIRADVRRTHIPFARMEAIRVSIAKHEVRGHKNSVANMPTMGVINRWCGSLDFELEHEQNILGTISRRDIADDIRAIPDIPLPTDDDIKSFDEYMRGPTADLKGD
jgi:hypothetical protein